MMAITGDNPLATAWDVNGQLTARNTGTFDYNWDGKLRLATGFTADIDMKYDPMGNRVYRESDNGSTVKKRKYIVDIASGLPTILCVLDVDNQYSLKSSYVYADAQPLVKRDHVSGDPAHSQKHYYVHDRLGSVRMMIGYNATAGTLNVANAYAYDPWGKPLDALDQTGDVQVNVENPFTFTGQWYDDEIEQYHLRARQYDPALMRFTARDPVRGDNFEPMTLHKYLYCVNEPIDRVDLSGRISATALTSAIVTGASLYGHGLSLATYSVATGDDRFWELADLTFKFMPFATAIASINPVGPMTNLITTGAIQLNQMAYGSTTGMSTVQGLAVDPFAFFAYRCVMGKAHEYIGTDTSDMQDFMSWMGVDWVEEVND